MVISQLLVNFIADHATKLLHFIASNFRKTFHLFLEYGELPALPILQITFKSKEVIKDNPATDFQQYTIFLRGCNTLALATISLKINIYIKPNPNPNPNY